MKRIPGGALFAYPALWLMEQRHRRFYHKWNPQMARALERFRRCPSGERKPPSRIRREMRLCRLYWKCAPLHYYRYDLFRRDKNFDEESLLDYIPEFFFYRIFLPLYDQLKYQLLLEDKLLLEEFFRCAGISQPAILGKLIGGRLFSREMEEKEFSVFERELPAAACPNVFVKPAEGRGGSGIFVFRREPDGGFRDAEGRLLNGDFLAGIGRRGDYIIQEGAVPVPALSEYYPHSANTFRVATENRNGRARVLCATMRMGRGGNQIDNGALGGLVLGVDINTGMVADKANTIGGERFERHPDTGFVFKGRRIPEWERIKAFALRSAEKLPRYCYLGWDIALTADGPMAIETNFGFGLDHFQASIGGLRRILLIRCPEEDWRRRAHSLAEEIR